MNLKVVVSKELITALYGRVISMDAADMFISQQAVQTGWAADIIVASLNVLLRNFCTIVALLLSMAE